MRADLQAKGFSLGSEQNLWENDPGSATGGQGLFLHPELGGRRVFFHLALGGPELFLSFKMGGIKFFYLINNVGGIDFFA